VLVFNVPNERTRPNLRVRLFYDRRQDTQRNCTQNTTGFESRRRDAQTNKIRKQCYKYPFVYGARLERPRIRFIASQLNPLNPSLYPEQLTSYLFTAKSLVRVSTALHKQTKFSNKSHKTQERRSPSFSFAFTSPKKADEPPNLQPPQAAAHLQHTFSAKDKIKLPHKNNNNRKKKISSQKFPLVPGAS